MYIISRVKIQGISLILVVQCSIGGTLMINAYRHPSVLDLITYYDNKDKENSKSTKNQVAKTRSGKAGH